MRCSPLTSLSLRSFSAEVDSVWLHELWHRALHSRWSISRESMQSVLCGADLLLVAEENGVRTGFCAVNTQEHEAAGLLLMLVEPSWQGRGIGTQLLGAVEASLRQRKVGILRLGAGSRSYFWPGLPYEQHRAWAFFANHQFELQEASQDLVQELAHFCTPAWVTARQLALGAKLRLAEPAWAVQLEAFEREHFPAWAPYFTNEIEKGGFCNILFAHGSDQRVLGTVLMRQDAAILWERTRGTRIGTLNTLGVALHSQGRGIGLALTAGAMEYLRDQGCSACHIQWTGLADWYGKLGARPWAHYRMASKHL